MSYNIQSEFKNYKLNKYKYNKQNKNAGFWFTSL